MKNMKKLASVLLAIVMVFAMNVTAFAADTNTYTITISNSAANYGYTAYQIFVGDLYVEEYTGSSAPADGTQLYTYDSDSNTYTAVTYDAEAAGSGTKYYTKVLSNVEFGSALSGESQTALLAAYASVLSSNGYESSAAGLAKALANGKITASDFAATVGAYTLTSAGTSSYSSSAYTISVTGAGYYLIKTTTVPATDAAYSSYILEVVGNVTVSDIKSDYPTLDKEVTSTTDSADTDTNETTADYSVGDNVPFELIATLPSNYGDYTTYKLTFHDTMDSALSFNNDVVVKVYTAYTGLIDWGTNEYYTYNSITGQFTKVDTGTETPNSGDTYYTATTVKTDGYNVATSTSETLSDSTCTFEVQIPNVKALTDASGDAITLTSASKIVVSFTANLTAEASSGVTNKAYLEYSNNPNETSGGITGKTPEDVTTVFTFTLDVNKVDSSSNALEGAGFTLYKKNASGEYVAVGSEAAAGYQAVSSLSAFETGVTYYTYDAQSDTYTEVTDTSGTPDSGTTYYVKNKFTFDGLGIGNYMLKETTTPNGYNTMDDIYFTVSATTKESNQVGSVSSLSVTVTDSSGAEITSGAQSFSTNYTTGKILTNITNYSGAELPTTGGIGTTIFYIVGGVLVAAAVVLLITRRRMSKSK